MYGLKKSFKRIDITYCSGDAELGALLNSEVKESTGTRKTAKALPMAISQNSSEQTGDGNCPNG